MAGGCGPAGLTARESLGEAINTMAFTARGSMFFPVHAHVCSTEASCSFMGPRRLIYLSMRCIIIRFGTSV